MNTTTIYPPLSGLASHLVNDGLLASEKILLAIKNAEQHGIPLVSFLVKHTILTSEAIMQSCVKQFGLKTFDLAHYDFSWFNHSTLTIELLQRYHAVPLMKQNDMLQIGMSDPTDQQALDTFTFHTGLRTCPVIVAEDQLALLLEKMTSKTTLELNLLHKISNDNYSLTLPENAVKYDEPLIKFVDHVLLHAKQQTVSDIHIEPYATECRIRYRRDGLLHEVTTLPAELAVRFVTRLKVIAKLDITERRLPQDGRFQLHDMDIRINTCPTFFGEKIVLRLLDVNKLSLKMERLGMNDLQKEIFIKKINQPHGLILITGPTGSGKTTTLYSALSYLNSTEKNISTVEDPVEIQLNGINQVNICPKIGLDFAAVLRTLLRQDPDVIMVGEIRDKETADIAMLAAQTGHLVLSTLHTNSALDTLQRLRSLGITDYNLTHSISLIIAQRLLRQLCPLCKQPETLDNDKLIFRAQGCRECLQGYHGRIGIYEFLPFTEVLTHLILSQATTTQLYSELEKEGFVSLRQMAKAALLSGKSSVTEMNRVIAL